MASYHADTQPEGRFLSNPERSSQMVSVDGSKCIICQKQTNVTITTGDVGRKRIYDAASIRDDIVLKRIKLLSDNDSFVYHSTNDCYKSYTLKKSLEKITKDKDEETDTQEPETDTPVIPETFISPHRSSSKPRAPASSGIYTCKLICVICGKQQCGPNRDTTKYRISESDVANNFLAAAMYFKDDVYERIADIDSEEKVFAADIYYHRNCLVKYIYKHESQLGDPKSHTPKLSKKFSIFIEANKTIQPLIEAGYGFTLSEIRDVMHGIDNTIDIQTGEVKSFIMKAYGTKVKICPSHRKNESAMVFSAELTPEMLANRIRSYNAVKDAATILRNTMKDVDFGLQDNFCDADELNKSWKSTRIPDTMVTFLATFFNVSKSVLFNPDMTSMMSDETEDIYDEEETPNQSQLSSQLFSLFQVMFFILNRGQKKSPLHILLGHSVYDKCKSRELITSLNRGAFSISYTTVLRSRGLLADYAVQLSQPSKTPLPSHFSRSPTEFTVAAFDNFDFDDKSSLSGTQGTHHTAMVLFQTINEKSPGKPNVSETGLAKKNNTLYTELPCQKIINHSKPTERPNLPVDFKTIEDYGDEVCKSAKISERNTIQQADDNEFIISLVRCGVPKDEGMPLTQSDLQVKKEIPTWGATHALLSRRAVPLKRVGFLPILPSPVTDYSTVYTALKNFQDVRLQLSQPILPIVCDEGVFHTLVDMYMDNPDEFADLYPMLGMFHFARVVLRCIGRFLTGSGMDDALLETGIFGLRTLQTVLSGTHYKRSLKGMLMVEDSIRNLQWSAFWKTHAKETYCSVMNNVDQLKHELENHNSTQSQEQFASLNETVTKLQTDFQDFLHTSSERSEVCKYWGIFLQMIGLLKHLIAADREGNWFLHVATVGEMMKICREWDCVNYTRYASWYLEKIKTLEQEHPTLYSKFVEGQFVVKDKQGKFNAVSPDMKLEQTIQRSQKSPKGIVGETRKAGYVAHWQLVYHEILAICNVYRELTNSKLMDHRETIDNHELSGSKSERFNINVERLLKFVGNYGNPYAETAQVQLYNFFTNTVATDDTRNRILNSLEHGQEMYETFREERFLKKEKKLSERISRTNLPSFQQKQKGNAGQLIKGHSGITMKHVSQAQKEIDIARERGEALEHVLTYDVLPDSVIFEDDIPTKPDKHTLMVELESNLSSEDYNLNINAEEKTTIMVDFMSQVRMLKATKLSNFGHLVNSVVKKAKSEECTIDQIHIIFDSYAELSLKECERIRRCRHSGSLEMSSITEVTPIPVQVDKFWGSSANKVKLQNFAKEKLRHDVTQIDGTDIPIVVSGMVLDGNATDALICGGQHETIIPELKNMCEEADIRIVPHVAWSVKNGAKTIIVLSNDTDVVVLLLHYMGYLITLGLYRLWIKYGTGDKTRYIPIHSLYDKLGTEMSRVYLKVHILTGADCTSKIGTKKSAVCAIDEVTMVALKEFAENGTTVCNSYAEIEQYLVMVWKKAGKETSFNELRYSEYRRHAKIDQLPPTTSTIRGHIMRSYFLIQENINLLNPQWRRPNPCDWGWIEVDGVLLPDKCLQKMPPELIVTCGCQACGDRRCKCRSKSLKCTLFCNCKVDFCKNKM